MGERLPTEFERMVLEAVKSIPRGETRTYREIAEMIGRPRAYRAVGNALRKNPHPIIIPCHRVVRSDGSLGGYSNGGTRVKRKLLLEEGALRGRM